MVTVRSFNILNEQTSSQMPQMNGFEVIEAVGGERMPLVIFVTAHDQHALKAFQVKALDYRRSGIWRNHRRVVVTTNDDRALRREWLSASGLELDSVVPVFIDDGDPTKIEPYDAIRLRVEFLPA